MTQPIQTNERFIPKKATNTIKGVALVIMLIHHFLTFPDWYVEGISYPALSQFALYWSYPTKICVCIFAFLTGFFYFFSKDHSLRYSIRKGTDVWVAYLITFFVLLIPAFSLGVYHFHAESFILELFALKRHVMTFCWYVIFYMTVMLILPLYARLSERSSALCFCLSLIAPFFLMYLGNKCVVYLPQKLRILNQVMEYTQWIPCVTSGYLFAKHDLFSRFADLLQTKYKAANILISLAMMYIAMRTRFFTTSYDFVCAPMFIYGVVGIWRSIPWKKVFVPLEIVGRYSLLIWFVHCIFFNVCDKYTQPVLYFTQNPVLVVLWGLLMCLLAAVILQFPVDWINKGKNRLFHLYSKPAKYAKGE